MALEIYSYSGQNVADEVIQKFGDIGQAQITSAMLLKWINNGQRKMADDLPFLEGVASTAQVAGQSAYDLSMLFAAQRVQNINSVMLNGVPIDILPFSQYQALVAAGSLDPTHMPSGAIWGSTLSIFPTPTVSTANALTIYFYQYPADLGALANPLTIPDRLYNGLVEYVTAQAYILDNDLQSSQAMLNQHQQSIQRQSGKNNQTPSEFYTGMTLDPYDNDAVY